MRRALVENAERSAKAAQGDAHLMHGLRAVRRKRRPVRHEVFQVRLENGRDGPVQRAVRRQIRRDGAHFTRRFACRQPMSAQTFRRGADAQAVTDETRSQIEQRGRIAAFELQFDLGDARRAPVGEDATLIERSFDARVCDLDHRCAASKDRLRARLKRRADDDVGNHLRRVGPKQFGLRLCGCGRHFHLAARERALGARQRPFERHHALAADAPHAQRHAGARQCVIGRVEISCFERLRSRSSSARNGASAKAARRIAAKPPA